MSPELLALRAWIMDTCNAKHTLNEVRREMNVFVSILSGVNLLFFLLAQKRGREKEEEELKEISFWAEETFIYILRVKLLLLLHQDSRL